jgi:hypothetical protein
LQSARSLERLVNAIRGSGGAVLKVREISWKLPGERQNTALG